MERCFLAWKQNQTTEALPHAEAALRLREAYQPKLEQPPATPEKMAALKEILNNWLILVEAYTRMGHAEASRQRLDGLRALVDRLLILLPDDSGVHYISISVWLQLGNQGTGDAQMAREYYTKAEAEAVLLLARDASNVQWRMAAVHPASRLETLYWQAGDEASRLAARRRMAERIEFLYSAGLTDVHFLIHVREWAVQCGDKHQGDDWPAARHHYTEALKAQRRVASLTSDTGETARLDRATGRVFDNVVEHEGQEAAEKWRQEFDAGK